MQTNIKNIIATFLDTFATTGKWYNDIMSWIKVETLLNPGLKRQHKSLKEIIDEICKNLLETFRVLVLFKMKQEQ